MGLIVTHCLRMKYHLAATVIRSARSLGLYLTARALTVHDHGFTSVCALRTMIILLDHSLSYLLLPEVKWA